MACDGQDYGLLVIEVAASSIKVKTYDCETQVGETDSVTLYASDGITIVSTGTSSPEYTFTGLVPNTTYVVMRTGKTGTAERVTTSTDDPKVATESQWQDLANRVKAKADSSSVPIIAMTTTDPGEGQPLAANHFIGVYE